MGALGGIFLVLVAGGVGAPIPEDLTLIAAGIVAHRGAASLLHAVLVGVAGVVCADWLIYLIGRRYGRSIVQKPLAARLFEARRLESVRGAVERRGVRAVFAARFVFGARLVTFLAAGTFGVPPQRFAIAEAAGAVIYVPAMVTLGFLFSERAERIMRDVTHAQHWLELVGLVALAGYLALRAWGARAGLGTNQG
jgi:membrane protein DedA with SNARE-associated domain